MRLRRLHAQVANRRDHELHDLTAGLVAGRDTIVVEDLAVAGMLRHRPVAFGVADAAFGELRRQLTYKTAWYGADLVVADRWFASSKTCSVCGQHHPGLRRGDRRFDCPACGLNLDRDHNAAINLARYRPDLPRSAHAA